MILSLYIFLALVAVGVVLKLTDRPMNTSGERLSETADEPEAGSAGDASSEGCCGMHITCERDSLLSSVSAEIEYFEDEELDAFIGRRPEEYTADEIELFREVLLTLPVEEIAAWGRSMQLRGIELPEDVREELLMIVSEARNAATL